MRKELPNMSKQKKQSQQTLPNNGRNRPERREQERKPRTSASGKPTWLRILIVAIIGAMLIGFCLAPIIGR